MLKGRVTELEQMLRQQELNSKKQNDRITAMMKQHFALESQLMVQVSTLNRTEVLNVLLRENLHEARQREIAVESRHATALSEAQALNLTVEKVASMNKRVEKDVSDLRASSDGKNRALVAAAKKYAGLAEQLIVLSGKLEVAKIILEKYLTPAQIKFEVVLLLFP